jgi:hypothetical protein
MTCFGINGAKPSESSERDVKGRKDIRLTFEI